MLTLWLRLAGKTIIIEIAIVKRNIFSDANEAGVVASLAPHSPEAEVQAQQEDPHPMDDDLEVLQEVTNKKEKVPDREEEVQAEPDHAKPKLKP